MLPNPFSFKGRIKRLYFNLTYFGINIIGWMMGEMVEGMSVEETYALLILFIPLLWILFAQRTKRCHDLGHNGWWQLIPLYDLFLIAQPREPTTNEYGDA